MSSIWYLFSIQGICDVLCEFVNTELRMNKCIF